MSATATKKKLRPLGSKLVVKKLEAKDKTDGGIYLPSGSQEKPLEGVVVAVGPGALNEKGDRQKMDLKEGDIVIYSKYAGTEIKVDNEDLLILSENEILAVVEA